MTTTDSQTLKMPVSELRIVVDELVSNWFDESASLKVKGLGVAQFGLIYGMAARSHSACRSSLLLLDHGHIFDAFALVRVAFENALTAHWILRVPDATHAVANRADRQRELMAETSALAFPNWSIPEPDLLASKLETTSMESAKKFYNLCLDLEPGGHQAYFIYRYLSSYCHASAPIADRFLEVESVDAIAPSLRVEARTGDSDEWLVLYHAALSLIWSGQAVDERVASHPRRTLLRRAAKEVKVHLRLNASGQAFQRTFRAQTGSNRSRRVGT